LGQTEDGAWDVLVVGAGQAGLALGRLLLERGLRFLLVDAASQIGASWRGRWDSLRLFTPAAYSALPGSVRGSWPHLCIWVGSIP
jgi:putative flavoprotein involved in K+ transport